MCHYTIPSVIILKNGVCVFEKLNINIFHKKKFVSNKIIKSKLVKHKNKRCSKNYKGF